MGAAAKNATPRPLRQQTVTPAQVPGVLQRASARLVQRHATRTVYQMGSGHLLVVRPVSAAATSIEIYPAGCAC